LEDSILGVYGYYDYRKTKHDNKVHQLTLGAEWLSEDFEARANIYLPSDEEFNIGVEGLQVRANSVANMTRIITSGNNVMESALPGFDVEFGGSLIRGYNPLEIYTSYYHFSKKGRQVINGGRVRLNQKINDNIYLEAEISHDNYRQTDYYVGARFNYNFGKSGEKSTLSALEKKMTQMPVRDIDALTTISEDGFVIEKIIDGKIAYVGLGPDIKGNGACYFASMDDLNRRGLAGLTDICFNMPGFTSVSYLSNGNVGGLNLAVFNNYAMLASGGALAQALNRVLATGNAADSLYDMARGYDGFNAATRIQALFRGYAERAAEQAAAEQARRAAALSA
jgi:hypothetical protein